MLDEIGRNPFVVKGELLPDTEAITKAIPKNYSELLDAMFAELAHRHGKER